MRTINASLAMFPGYTCEKALDLAAAGISEPFIGAIAVQHVQLAPQNIGTITEGVCEQLAQRHPGTRLRLHANARILPRHHLIDASNFGPDTRFYFEALADRSRRLGAPAYSVHAGYKENCSFGQLLDNVRRIQDIFGPDCCVAVEGLYRNAHRPQHMDCWREYEAVLAAGIPQAVDLSHLNIVARAERSHGGALLTELLASRNTIEIHCSANDGRRDEHSQLTEEPWWWASLAHVHPDAVLFTESDQLRAARRAGVAVH